MGLANKGEAKRKVKREVVKKQEKREKRREKRRQNGYGLDWLVSPPASKIVDRVERSLLRQFNV
jgi:hypothetical protein